MLPTIKLQYVFFQKIMLDISCESSDLHVLSIIIGDLKPSENLKMLSAAYLL